MTEMNKNDMQLFRTIAQMKDTTLLKSMAKLLERYYSKDKIIVAPEYILCGEGDIPVMLVAHMDTVFKNLPSRIYYDQKQRIMWSPQGLGADDRAGVFAIAKILSHGYRPSICLTMGEEMGGIGATKLVKDIPKCPFDLKYVIQLDRQGTDDCVFYDCDNEKFTEYIERFGFITDWGTFTDICDICPEWEVAGVNLSVGYKNEHSEIETLNTDALYATIKKVERMLCESKSLAEKFEYIPDAYPSYYAKMLQKYGSWTYYEDEWMENNCCYQSKQPYNPYAEAPTEKGKCQCINCRKIYSEDDVFPVKSRKYKDAQNYYCINCVTTGINWCSKCGEPFEVDTPNDELCPDCAGKQLPRVAFG